MNATEIILSGIVFVLFLGLWDAHNRLDDFGKWQRACISNIQPKKVKRIDQKWGELHAIIEHKDTTISMLNKQIKELNAENEKHNSWLNAKDDYINELKGDLTKCKHDYACEVAGAKSSRGNELVEDFEPIEGTWVDESGEIDGEAFKQLTKPYRKP